MMLVKIEGTGRRAEDISQEMADRIKEIIYEYAGVTTVPAAVGVLHIVAAEIIEECRE